MCLWREFCMHVIMYNHFVCVVMVIELTPYVCLHGCEKLLCGRFQIAIVLYCCHCDISSLVKGLNKLRTTSRRYL